MLDLFTYFTTLGSLEMIGVMGCAVYIGAFGSVQFEFIDGNSATYSIANVLAATLVDISLLAEFNLACALIQGSWIIIGLAGLALRRAKSEPTSQSHFQNTSQTGVKSWTALIIFHILLHS